MSDFRAGSNLVSATFQTLSSFRHLPPSDHFLLSSGRVGHEVEGWVVDVFHGLGRWGGKGSGREWGMLPREKVKDGRFGPL